MKFQLIGINHKTAPVEVRERLAIPDSRLGEAMKRLAEHPGVDEGLILCTCNRVELITRSNDGNADLRGFIREYFRLEPSAYEPHLYEYRENEAVRHLFRVTSSLDSMIVGEPQILGQVKVAYSTARDVGAVGSRLDQLFTRAFAVAKRVRTETAIGSSSVSVASVAVELAKKIFGSLQGKHVYLVGAGKMSELAARHLLANGASSIFVANRTYERAARMANAFNGQAIHFNELYETCDRADIIITSTGAPTAIFRKEHGERFMSRRKGRPMFFIDIAVPRDIDPAMNQVDGIFLYDIDDLQQAVASGMADRANEAKRAEAIVDTEVEGFEARLRALDVVPTIIALQEQLEVIRRDEIERARTRLGDLTPEQQQALESLTRGIVNKIVHPPISVLKASAAGTDVREMVDLVHRVFNLKAQRPRS
jgi:glutamyl-tRNA reductase